MTRRSSRLRRPRAGRFIAGWARSLARDRMVTCTLTVALLGNGLMGFGPSCYGGPQKDTVDGVGVGSPEQPQFFARCFRRMTAEEVLQELQEVESRRALSFLELMDRGNALLLERKCVEAKEAYRAAESKTRDEQEKAAALLHAAQCACFLEQFREAGEMANQAGELAPESKDIACYRYAFWSSAGDELEKRIARKAMEQSDLDLRGKEVCEPCAVVVIVLTVGLTAYAIHKDAVGKEDVGKVLIALTAITTGLVRQSIAGSTR